MRPLVALSSGVLAVAAVTFSVPCHAQTAQAEEPNRPFFFRGGAGLSLASIRETNASVNGVPPGDYRILAWTAPPSAPDLLSGAGQTLTLQAGEHRTLSLEAIQNGAPSGRFARPPF